MKSKLTLLICNFIYFIAFLSIGFMLFNDIFIKQELSFFTIPVSLSLLVLNYFILVKKESLSS
jgi:uncharacterized membrane protein